MFRHTENHGPPSQDFSVRSGSGNPASAKKPSGNWFVGGSTDLLSFYNTKQQDRHQNKWWNKHISDLFICFVRTVSPQPNAPAPDGYVIFWIPSSPRWVDIDKLTTDSKFWVTIKVCVVWNVVWQRPGRDPPQCLWLRVRVWIQKWLWLNFWVIWSDTEGIRFYIFMFLVHIYICVT